MSKKPVRTCRRVLEEISGWGHHRPVEVFRTFCQLAACCLSMGQRENEYLQEIKRWKPSEQKLFAEAFGLLVNEMEEGKPYADLLGPLYMEWGGGSNGEFYTPWDVCRLMAKVTVGDLDPNRWRPLTINEPCCGSGSMILATASHFKESGLNPTHKMLVTAQDVSAHACNMCFVNLALWMIPARVICGNTLSLEVRHVWHTPAWSIAYTPELQMLEILEQLTQPLPEPPKPKPGQQLGFDFMDVLAS